MRSMIINLWTVCFLCSGLLAVHAATHYLVPTNMAAANPYTSWETASTSVIDVVKAAMSNSSSPRIVQVSNGVYVLTNTVTITNDVTLRGVNGRDTAIFNGSAAYNFVLGHTSCVLDGLTITNGYTTGGGGGIYISGGTVTNCLITDCVNSSAGGGVCGGGIRMAGIGIVANNVIRRNISYLADGGGGGIYINGGTNTVKNCIIEYNLAAKSHGGGISMGYSVPPLVAAIENCLIRYNMATNGAAYGGGMFLWDQCTNNVLVANCTIVSNSGAVSGGVEFYGTGIKSNIVLNCVILSNKGEIASKNNIHDLSYPASTYAVAYSCSTSNQSFILDCRGNTTNDPKFVDFQGENYRFNRYSPCFNSVTNQDWMTNAIDLDSHARILHGRVDMGAYELFIPDGTMFRGR